MNPTDAQILACNGDPDEPIISGPDADLIAFARAVLSLADDPHKVEREAHFALQDRMFFKSENHRVRTLQDAVEGEMDGLGISDSIAAEILRHLDVAERAVAFRMRGPSGGAWELTDDFGLAGDLLNRGWEVQPLAALSYISDREVERIAGRDELTGDAILRFARDLLAVASGATKP